MILARTIRHAPYIGYHHRGHPFRKIQESSTKRSKCGMQSTEWKEVGNKHLLPKKLQYRFFMVHYRILESIYTHHQFTIS